MATLAERGMALGSSQQMYMFEGMVLDSNIMGNLKTIKSRDMRKDDILLCAYTKSGTHWVWEILNMIVAGKPDYAKHWQNGSWLEYRTEEEINELESPRILHTHVWPEMLPESVWKKCKILTLERDPKDCLVSRFCQVSSQTWTDSVTQQKKPTFTGKWEDFVTGFLEGAVFFGSWFDFVNHWNKFLQSRPEIQYCKLQYEDLKKDCVKEIKKMATFLERPLSDEMCRAISEACDFEKLKHVSEKEKDQTFHIKWQPGTSGYFRKGTIGDWKNWLTVAQNERFDQVYEEKMGRKYDG